LRRCINFRRTNKYLTITSYQVSLLSSDLWNQEFIPDYHDLRNSINSYSVTIIILI